MAIHFPKDENQHQQSNTEETSDTQPLTKESLELEQFARKVGNFQKFVSGYEEVGSKDVNLCMDAAARLAVELEEKTQRLLARAEESATPSRMK